MSTFRLPLPMYGSHRIGSVQSKDGDTFEMYVGLDKNLVKQLKQKSLDDSDEELQKNTSDRKRFGEGSYETWYAKDRTPFALVSNSHALAALAWFGPKPLGRKSLKYLSEAELAEEGRQKKDTWHTIVYRSYPPFRGKGLMNDFLQQVMQVYRQHYPSVRLWAGMSGNNAASATLASKLGFEKVEELVDTKANWFAMVKKD